MTNDKLLSVFLIHITRIPNVDGIYPPAWCSKWGYSGFYRDQNNHDSSGAYVTCIYCSQGVKKKKKHMGKVSRCSRLTHACVRRSWAHFVCINLFPRVCLWQGPKYPNRRAPQLTTPLQGVVQEIWDLPSVSIKTHKPSTDDQIMKVQIQQPNL